MNGKDKKILIISFLLGSIITLGITKYNLLGVNNTIIKNGTHIYEKTSLYPAIEKIYDAVVEIQSFQYGEESNNGTGFIYRTDEKYGYILTNEHVIKENSEIKVFTMKDEEVPVTILGKDSYLDLAVLRIDKKYVSLVSTIGSSESMNLGDTVFTVGSPLGQTYRGSITSGILSGKNRMVSTSLTNNEVADWVMNVLQVDASINPGNSGGPLLNVNGEVIGICSLKLIRDNIEGMGFAIPIEYAMSHIKTLESGNTIDWPSLGISMINVKDKSTLMIQDLTVPDTIKEGVVIKSIKENGSAQKYGLTVGDIITKIDNKKVKDIAFLKYELYKHQAGETITVTYIRNNKENSKKIVLSSSKEES